VHHGRSGQLWRRLDGWSVDAVDRGDLYAQVSLSLIRIRTQTLAAHEPLQASEQVDAALLAWKSSEFGVQRFLAEISRVQIALYLGDPERAVQVIERIWPEFSRSLMQRIQLCRIHMYHHTAYALIAAAVMRRAGGERLERTELQRITKQAEQLEKEGTPWAAAFASHIRAALLDLTGRIEPALEAYAATEKALGELGMTLYAAACRARRGQRLGGEEGKMLQHTAFAVLSAQGILRPDRVVAMMAPGIE
jgi:hypothetical protein